MGSVCGKETGDNFSSPGRPVGSAPPQSKPKTAPIPATARVGGPPRTLGGGNPSGEQSSADAADARRRAAEAAEVSLPAKPHARAKAANKPTGKLGSQLNAQKKQTQSDLLKDASAQKLRQRDADAAAEARTFN
ncbi:hypothetical protein CMUS01_00810 [Colletotrichum musicola]|uniref:Uncharacterized protein n=1 Tax=Colletotrichum musicola TaxID=2175873 RepID=A0A8H6NY81_9PEZI|nr:hypothetical protein CMUS01_00810 [Colletotrichum musicola]